MKSKECPFKFAVSLLLTSACVLGVLLSIWSAPRAQAAPAAAPNTTPAIDGTIAASEYGSHVNGQNQQTSGGQTVYMTWDTSNLYIAYANANTNEGAVLYIDINPIVPANGGTNANGNLTGQAYDGTNFTALPFRADFVTYFKNGYREYRAADGSGGWSGATTGFGTYADNGSNVRELAIPWSALGGQPTSFNFFAYATSSGGYVYGQVPTGNTGGNIGTGATYNRYYLVANTSAPSYPFAADSPAVSCYATYDDGVTVFNSADAQAVRNALGAVSAGGTVKVAGYCAGAISQSGTTQVALITKMVTLAGGYTTTNWTTYNPIGNPAILDAQGGGRVISITNVVVTLQGFTVTNGYIDAGSRDEHGGGIYAAGALTLMDMSVFSNTITGMGGMQNGGGVYAVGNAQVTNSRPTQNSARANGGGAYVGGLASVTGAIFSGNTTMSYGGGAAFGGPASVMGTTFLDNTSGYVCGGAVFYDWASVTRTTFAGNSAATAAGGACFIGGDGEQVVNVLFARNRAGAFAAAMYVQDSSSFSLNHTTIGSPTVPIGAAEAIFVNNGTVYITNTLIASHTVGIQRTGGGTVTAWNTLFSNVGTQTIGAVGNNSSVTGNAHFVDPANDNYHLGPDSAAVDAAVTPNPLVTTDFDGDTRPQGIGYDIGYDEVLQQCGLSTNTDYSFSSPAAIVSFSNLGNANCVAGVYMPRAHPNSTGTGGNGVGQDHFWQIAARTGGGAAATGFTAAITLPHSSLTAPKICFYPGALGGLGWDCTGTQSFDGSQITRQGLTHFSDWAVGNNVGPTAIGLNSLRAESADRIYSLPIGLTALLALTIGAALVIKRRRHPAL